MYTREEHAEFAALAKAADAPRSGLRRMPAAVRPLGALALALVLARDPETGRDVAYDARGVCVVCGMKWPRHQCGCPVRTLRLWARREGLSEVAG